MCCLFDTRRSHDLISGIVGGLAWSARDQSALLSARSHPSPHVEPKRRCQCTDTVREPMLRDNSIISAASKDGSTSTSLMQLPGKVRCIVNMDVVNRLLMATFCTDKYFFIDI